MGELDYQTALLLQHRFEQECNSLTNTERADAELAKQIQEAFKQEDAIERPSTSLVYYHPKKDPNSAKSLVDPSWELVDPTPDIHILFMAFNEQFFWNTLLPVCVSWSKRMTSCAGVCSYDGRGGMCSITLSEPLLKLRPRKDLVETLLHEMIHAYLFVTHNNKDRDGHGPEFCKHMYRINKESGTNITVYHNFHDEVKLYQQHWWRCNGPCQQRKPFFGMVRRATNRAPGPYDRWWGEHLRTCGGTFIKVKEPEKKKKTETKRVKSKDIRDVLPAVKPSGSNITALKDLTNKVKGKYNSSSTIVVTKNTNTGDSGFKPTVFNATDNNKKTKTNIASTSQKSNTVIDYTNDFVSVRNHWANKFNTTNKRPAIEEATRVSKLPKVSNSVKTKTPTDEFCECPVCNQRVLMVDLNQHLDLCLIESSKDNIKTVEDLTKSPELKETRECPVCETKVASSNFDVHVQNCVMQIYEEIEERLTDKGEKNEETVSCLSCHKKISKSELNLHLEECMANIFDGDDENELGGICDKKGKNIYDNINDSEYNCPFCLKLVEETEMKNHIDICLSTNNAADTLLEDF